MNKIIKNVIIKPIVFILVLLVLLFAAGLISDMTREGTHFTRSVTDSKDAKLIKEDYWGFVDLLTRFHFTANPETIDNVITKFNLAPVKEDELIMSFLPKEGDWTSPPGKVSSYRYQRYWKSTNEATLGQEFLDYAYVLQHNQKKDEAFYFSADY